MTTIAHSEFPADDLGIAAEQNGRRACAKAFLSVRFEPIAEAGHLAHIKQPEGVLDLTREFAGETSRAMSRSVDALNGE